MEVAEKLKIPLFPLNTVLFPGGALPLRVFEPRYLDMVSDCLKSESGIGVVLIEDGNEVGAAPKIHDVGTMSYISYWHKRNDGMLGVTLTGLQRFRILSTETKSDQLVVAEVELLPNIENQQSDEAEEGLINLLKQIISQLEPPYTTMSKHYDDLEWVSARLIELLPLELDEKQKMLHIGNVQDRMSCLKQLLIRKKIL